MAVVSTTALACGGDETADDLVAANVKPAPPPEDFDRSGPIPTRPPFLPTAEEGVRAVWFEASDGTGLVGRLFGDDRESDRGVLLLHSSGSSMGAWFPLARILMKRGYVVFVLDFRGYGQSRGKRTPKEYPVDVEAGLDVLDVFGADRVTIAGVEVGGTAALGIPETRWEAVRGLVTVGSTPTFGGLDVRAAARRVEARTLVLDGSGRDEGLATLVPGAERKTLTLGEVPAGERSVMAEVERFVADAIGEP